MDSDLLAAAACRAITIAIWRQVARDVISPSPARRAEGVAFLMSDMAVTWAQRFDPDCDPDIVIQAVLVAGRDCRVRHTRHSPTRDSRRTL